MRQQQPVTGNPNSSICDTMHQDLPEILYDGTFEGLLTAFADALRDPGDPAGFVPEKAQHTASLFGSRVVRSNTQTATDLLADIQTSGGTRSRQTILLGFLGEGHGFELDLFHYVRDTLAQGRCIDGWYGNEAARAVTALAAKVSREIHRFKGLLRFSQLQDGAFYAPFEPDHNVIVPVARHFTRRLGDQRWVIHDRKRNIALLWDTDRLHPADVAFEDADGGTWEDLLAADETFYRECWRRFTRHIAIGNRHNPRLQRAFMPARYWPYLVEMQTGTGGPETKRAAGNRPQPMERSRPRDHSSRQRTP
jgi:probable DNA metabolism protein